MKHERIEIQTTDGVAWVERLTPRQMISLGDRIWSEKRRRLIQDLKDGEIHSEQRIVALSNLESKRGLMSMILEHAMMLNGSIEIIEEAANSKNAENADGLPDNFDGTNEDAIRIAIDLIGIEFDIEEPSESKKKSKKK